MPAQMFSTKISWQLAHLLPPHKTSYCTSRSTSIYDSVYLCFV